MTGRLKMNLNTIFLIITIIFSGTGLFFTITWNVKNKIAMNKIVKAYYDFYKLHWIDKKRGFPDECKDIQETFLYEYFHSKF
jgi:hypothetical protein